MQVYIEVVTRSDLMNNGMGIVQVICKHCKEVRISFCVEDRVAEKIVDEDGDISIMIMVTQMEEGKSIDPLGPSVIDYINQHESMGRKVKIIRR